MLRRLSRDRIAIALAGAIVLGAAPVRAAAPEAADAPPAVAESDWTALRYKRVAVETSELALAGFLAEVDGPTAKLITSDGDEVLVEKAQATRLEAVPPPVGADGKAQWTFRDDRYGRSMIIAGASLIGVGTAFTIMGAVFVPLHLNDDFFSGYDIGAGVSFVTAGLALGSGIPLLVIGLKRRKMRNRPVLPPGRSMSLGATPTRHGWLAGVHGRF